MEKAFVLSRCQLELGNRHDVRLAIAVGCWLMCPLTCMPAHVVRHQAVHHTAFALFAASEFVNSYLAMTGEKHRQSHVSERSRARGGWKSFYGVKKIECRVVRLMAVSRPSAARQPEVPHWSWKTDEYFSKDQLFPVRRSVASGVMQTDCVGGRNGNAMPACVPAFRTVADMFS